MTATRCVFDFDGAQIFIGDKIIQLCPREAQLFGLLMRRPGRVIMKDWIISTIWNLDEPADPAKCLDVFVCHMREKFRGLPISIKTHYRAGYSLVIEQ